MNLSTNLLALNSALESTTGTLASDGRNSSMFGGSQNSADPDTALEQTQLIKHALESLTAIPPHVTGRHTLHATSLQRPF